MSVNITFSNTYAFGLISSNAHSVSDVNLNGANIMLCLCSFGTTDDPYDLDTEYFPPLYYANVQLTPVQTGRLANASVQGFAQILYALKNPAGGNNVLSTTGIGGYFGNVNLSVVGANGTSGDLGILSYTTLEATASDNTTIPIYDTTKTGSLSLIFQSNKYVANSQCHIDTYNWNLVQNTDMQGGDHLQIWYSTNTISSNITVTSDAWVFSFFNYVEILETGQTKTPTSNAQIVFVKELNFPNNLVVGETIVVSNTVSSCDTMLLYYMDGANNSAKMFLNNTEVKWISEFTGQNITNTADVFYGHTYLAAYNNVAAGTVNVSCDVVGRDGSFTARSINWNQQLFWTDNVEKFQNIWWFKTRCKPFIGIPK